MSEQLIATLNEQLRTTQSLVGAQKSAKNKVLSQLKDAQARIEALQAEAKKLEAERDQFKAQAEQGPQELQKQLQELQAGIKVRDARDLFAQAVGPDLQDGVPVEDIWTKVGFDPTKVETLPTSDQVAELVSQARERAGYLFKPPSAQADPTASPVTPASSGQIPSGSNQVRPNVGPPPGTGRAPSSSGFARLRYSEKEVQVPGWQVKNPALAEALREGRADCIDG